jgi:hypothetical protein
MWAVGHIGCLAINCAIGIDVIENEFVERIRTLNMRGHRPQYSIPILHRQHIGARVVRVARGDGDVLRSAVKTTAFTTVGKKHCHAVTPVGFQHLTEAEKS